MPCQTVYTMADDACFSTLSVALLPPIPLAAGGELPDLNERPELRTALSPCVVAWHPAISIFGTPAACVLGLHRGTLLKCNIAGLPEPLALFPEQSKPLPRTGPAAISKEFLQGGPLFLLPAWCLVFLVITHGHAGPCHPATSNLCVSLAPSRPPWRLCGPDAA